MITLQDNQEGCFLSAKFADKSAKCFQQLQGKRLPIYQRNYSAYRIKFIIVKELLMKKAYHFLKKDRFPFLVPLLII